MDNYVDKSSFSNWTDFHVKHIYFDWTVRFDKSQLIGNVRLTVTKINNKNEFILDVKDLRINRIKLLKDGVDSVDLKYTVGDAKKQLGSPLIIDVSSCSWNNGSDILIQIDYETSPNATGLQWLKAEQTSGKKYSFLYSQCQAIHARSLFPCQDTPAIKFTFDAKLKVDSVYTALMSGLADDVENVDQHNIFKFTQPNPIPSYLLAIVVGKLSSKLLGNRVTVWAEDDVIDAAANEFDKTEYYLHKAEELCGPYLWKNYGLVILPFSFPFGGMENPQITFVTPSVISGDKSLTGVIIHEIIHSWTGNLVTTKSFCDFWLNEGFTVFLERKVIGAIYGEPVRHLEAISGIEDLRQAITLMGDTNPFTALVPNIGEEDPDDAFSTCPYEKGHTFLFYLENLLGGATVFDSFIRDYLENFKFKSLNTEEFVNFFKNYFKNNDKLNEIDWNMWLYTTGMPPIIPEYDGTLRDEAENLVMQWIDWDTNLDCPFKPDDLKKFEIAQLILFASYLLNKKTTNYFYDDLNKVKRLEELYELDKMQNSEIKYRWLSICVKAKYKEKLNDVWQFLSIMGRMKFVRPIYRYLYEWEEVRPLAIEKYYEFKPHMMFVTANEVAKDLHLK